VSDEEGNKDEKDNKNDDEKHGEDGKDGRDDRSHNGVNRDPHQDPGNGRWGHGFAALLYASVSI